MSSITIAVSDGEHRVPGFAVEAAADLACMHDPTVRQWIADHRPAGDVLVAEPEWVNRGDGTGSLTFPVDDRDARAVSAMWSEVMATPIHSESCGCPDHPEGVRG